MMKVFSGEVPFHLHNNQRVISMVIAGERPSRPAVSPEFGLSDKLWGMMENCWDQQPAKRPTMTDVCVSLTDDHPEDNVFEIISPLNVQDESDAKDDGSSVAEDNTGEVGSQTGWGLPQALQNRCIIQ